MQSDDSLWSRSRLGDADAFAQLFERHANAIYNYCFRRVGEWSTAEDLLSIVFLEAWRRRRVVLPPGKVVPWLYGIATNVVRNQRRAQRRYAAALRRMPTPRGDEAFGDSANSRVDDESQMLKVLALIGKLPQREQEVFALCAWSGLSYEDAASALGIPIGTVRSRLSRARARLRDLEPALGRGADDTNERVQEVFDR
jgi:RNA polymerase sigma-70 factor (ECF subfamily)